MAVELTRLYEGKRYHAGLFAVLAVVAFFATALLILEGDQHFSGTAHKRLSQVAVAFWSVGPPLWFFFEYFYYFPKYGNSTAGFAGLKAAQDVTAKVWAAIAVLLGVFYAITFPGK